MHVGDGDFARPYRLVHLPVLLRRERDVGHGARALSRSVALTADTLSFAASRTGLDVG